MRKLTIESISHLAKERGGELLSSEYKNGRSQLLWKCSQGHEWKALIQNIKRGHWCPYCSGNVVWSPGKSEQEARLSECQSLAQELGGKCLSSEYKSNSAKLNWQCAQGHIFSTTRTSVKNGHWCNICSGNAKKNLWELQAIAEKRGGICLADNYLHNKAPLLWRCAEGHEWEASANKILRGRWCYQCSKGQGIMEGICREFFERITKKTWPKTRPKWLISGSGNKMELDGYCQSLNVAFEYHGKQHYEYNLHFHRGANTLEKRQQDDGEKRRLCKANGINLIEIPYTLAVEELPKFLTSSLSEAVGQMYELPDSFSVNDLGYDRGFLKELNDLAESKGGKCLSKTYTGVENKLSWSCANGHDWVSTPKEVKKGAWCPYCTGQKLWAPNKTQKEARLDECYLLANQRNGEFLSTEYVNALTKYVWRCSEGHKWEAKLNDIKGGHWCPTCAGVRVLTIKEMNDLATSRGGKCLSKIYINSSQKLFWQCDKNHDWSATQSSIKNGSWCPYCSGKKLWSVDKSQNELRLKECNEIASLRGGECISAIYKSSYKKLDWRCSNGHEWSATPISIKRGSWCAYCYGHKIWSPGMEENQARLLECIDIALKQGGECISEKYINSKTKMKWRCTHKHEWEAPPATIKGGHWCPFCAGVRVDKPIVSS